VNVVDYAEHVARDLHDGPLQDVFATRLRLDAIAARVSPDIASEIHQLSELQGRIITRMRNLTDSNVTDMSRQPSERLADAVRDASISLGFTPHCSIDHRVDSLQDAALVSDIVNALRESLSNVARHAGATRARILISVGPTTLRFTVRDNGVGIPPSGHRGNGLVNLRTRAERNGGACTFRDAAGGGTVVEWWVRTTA
jgi:signal transduction histidine kinase